MHVQACKEPDVITKFLKNTAFAALMAFAVPAAAAADSPVIQAGAGIQIASLPAASAVARYYDARRNAPIWFKAGQGTGAAIQLVNILKQAPIEGLAIPSDLAVQVEAAVARAQASPAAAVEADRLLSTAWVAYVQALSAPTRGMIYADSFVMPKTPSAELVLARIAAAPSLSAHLKSVSDVNPIYAALRSAAIEQAKLPGGGTSLQLAANLDRARSLPARGRFVMVDAATQRLWMYEDGRIVDSMKVIVGMNELPTPMIASMLYYTTFNPYWHVPDHLVRKTLAPDVLKMGPGYLKSHGYQIVSEWDNNSPLLDPASVNWKGAAAGTVHVKIRQLPGGDNSMGKMKFPFPNGEGIYLHDTPDKAKFAQSLRTMSNGCIRLEDAPRLARWLFGHEPAALTSTAPEQYVPFAKGVPVYVTYLTAQPQLGEVTPVKDIYGRDQMQAARTAALPTAGGS